MVSGCGAKIIKFIFFTFNLLFCAIGAIICGLAVWLRFDNEFQTIASNLAKDANVTSLDLEQFFNDFENDTYIVLYVLMGLAVFMFITGFLGCMGAWCESVCLLGLFFSVVLTLFCIEIAGAIYIYIKQDDFRLHASTWYQQVVDRKGDVDHGADVAALVDKINKQFSCCDAHGCTPPASVSPLVMPPSNSCQCVANPSTKGCPDAIIDQVIAQWRIAAIVGGVILLIELLAMIFACCLCADVRTGRDYEYYY